MNRGGVIDKISDTGIILFLLFCLIVFLYIFAAYISGSVGMGNAISQGPVAASAVIFTLLSYRYTVKSNLRSSLNEVDPVAVQEYRVKPVLHNVKWRSEMITWVSNKIMRTSNSERVDHYTKRLLRSQTVVRFSFYHKSGYPVNAKEAFKQMNIDPSAFSDADDIYPDEHIGEFQVPEQWDEDFVSNRWELRLNLTGKPNLQVDGLQLICDTTEGREVQELANRVLRRLVEESKSRK